MPFDLNIWQILLFAIGTWQTMRLIQGFALPSLPIRLMSFAYFVNYVLGSTLSYHFDPWLPPLRVYAMQVDLEHYFKFILPFMSILVLFEVLMSRMVDQCKANDHEIQRNWRKLILIGFLAGTLQKVFPGSLSFYLYLASLIAPIAYILIADLNRSPFVIQKWFWIAFFWPFWNSFTTGMFYDLLLLIGFLAGKLSLSNKPSFFRSIVFLFLSVQLALFVQEAKHYLRRDQVISLEIVKNILEDSFQIDENSTTIAALTTRLNQGYILSHVLKKHEQSSANHENGTYLTQLAVSSVLPRFIMPNKLTSGDRHYFEKHSGLTLVGNTAMGLGLIAESTIDFGTMTGPFLFGLLLFIIYGIVRALQLRPYFSLYFVVATFYFIRPDCDMITALGHFTKSTLVFLAISFLLGNRKNEFVPSN